ncbi:Gfo/Idh/MocA family oxidoreductase [Haploplasma axanthum]|nr:Gfo/Idh/MocA family oxidoreductase [Haploplasma axanthum]
MKKINVALIGYGMAGREFHAPPISLNKDFNLKMIMTRNNKNQEDAKKLYPNIEIITEYNDAVNNKDIDLIIIATSNDVHYEYTEKALKAKKHVVCEKPFVETYEKAKKLYDLADENGVLLRVFHNRKYDGDIITLKEILNKKDFGRLVSFNTRFDQYNPSVSNNWRFSETDMAGIFYDLAPHLVHHAVDLFGLPRAVYNKLYFDKDGSIVDDHFEMILSYDNGFKAFIGAEMLEREPKPRLMVTGTNSTYVKYGFDSPDSLNEKPNDIYQTNELRSELINKDLKIEKIPLYKGQQYMFYDKVAKDIFIKPVDDIDKELALNVILIMEMALKSNKLNKDIIIKK